MNFKNAVGYIRVSTEGQVGDDKFGIDSQKQSILLYANENGYNRGMVYRQGCERCQRQSP